MSTATIPSPAEAIKASLAESANATDTSATEAAQIINDAKAADAAKTATATDAKVEAKTESQPAKTEVKALSSFESDDAPAAEPDKKAAATTDEPRDGEKPAQFIKRLKQERADALAQLEQLKKSATQRQDASPDEITELRRQLAERDEVIETTAFERSKTYQEKFAKPIEKATTGAKDLIAKFTETKGVFEQAKALDGKDRLDFLKEHVGEAAGTVFDRLARIDELSADRDAAVKDRAEISKAVAAEREIQNTSDVLKAFDGQRESISKKLSIYRGDQADALVAQAKTLLSGEASADDIISAAYLAAAAPHYISQLKEARATIAQLEARIAEDSGDRASVNGRGADTSIATNGFIKDGRVLPMGDVLKAQLSKR